MKKAIAKLKSEGIVNCMIDAAYKEPYRQEMKDGYKKFKTIHEENKAKKREEKEAKQAAKEYDEYESSLKYSADFLTRLDGVRRKVIKYNNQPVIVRVAYKYDFYDDKLVKYTKKLSKSQLLSREYKKHKLFIKMKNTYAQVFETQKYDENVLLLSLRPKEENKQNLEPDFAMIRFDI